MKSARSLSGLLSTLGLKDTAESPDITLAWAFPVQHLVRHGFPHGCVQIYSHPTAAAVAAQNAFIKVIGGAGNTWLKYVQPDTTAADVIMITRAAGNPLAEASNTPSSFQQLPDPNGSTSGLYTGAITAATLAGVPQTQRFLLPFSAGVINAPNECDIIIPRGQILYFVHPTANVALTLSLFAWETCPD